MGPETALRRSRGFLLAHPDSAMVEVVEEDVVMVDTDECLHIQLA